MSTVESPSHWRYFENKTKVKGGDYSYNYDKVWHTDKKQSPIKTLKSKPQFDSDNFDRIILKQEIEEKNRAKLLKTINMKKQLKKEKDLMVIEPL